MSRKTLKPCPFCGGRATLERGDVESWDWGVLCRGCTASVGSDDKEEAVERWNRRFPESAVVPPLAPDTGPVPGADVSGGRQTDGGGT